MTNDADAPGKAEKKPGTRKKVHGNLPYMTNHGRIKPVLEKIITAAKPDRLTQDYLDKVFGMPAGTYKTVLPILRRVGIIGADGAPTELYSRFRSEETRPAAVYQALKNGFAELFKRSEHIYAAPDNKLSDIIMETTGLAKGDPVITAIKGTFKAFSSYLPEGFTAAQLDAVSPPSELVAGEQLGPGREAGFTTGGPVGLSYHINIVLPETKDAEVYNLIFKSLRDNLLRQ
jgi:hypothetical protein